MCRLKIGRELVTSIGVCDGLVVLDVSVGDYFRWQLIVEYVSRMSCPGS